MIFPAFYAQYKKVTAGNIVNKLFPLALAALCLTTPASAQITSFRHIILVVQENRTPDNMFQGLCPASNPSACSTQPSTKQYNILTTGWYDKTSSTGATNPVQVRLGLGYDLDHSHPGGWVSLCDYDATVGNCKMDGAALVPCDHGACPPKAALAYVRPSDVQPYLDMVAAYGWANYFFQTNQGPSYPAHQFLFGATSAPSAADDRKGIFAAENAE